MYNPVKPSTQRTQDEEKQKHNTLKQRQTCVLLQTTGGKDEPNTVFMRK